MRDYCFKEMMWKSNGMVLKVMLIKNMRPFIRICSRSLMIPVWIAGNPEITEKNEDYALFCEALNYINETLAKKMAGDGEGCTALFEVKIVGAESKELGSKSSGNQWKRRWPRQ